MELNLMKSICDKRSEKAKHAIELGEEAAYIEEAQRASM